MDRSELLRVATEVYARSQGLFPLYDRHGEREGDEWAFGLTPLASIREAELLIAAVDAACPEPPPRPDGFVVTVPPGVPPEVVSSVQGEAFDAYVQAVLRSPGRVLAYCPEVRALVDAAQRGIERGSFDQDRRVALMLAVNAFQEQDDV